MKIALESDHKIIDDGRRNCSRKKSLMPTMGSNIQCYRIREGQGPGPVAPCWNVCSLYLGFSLITPFFTDERRNGKVTETMSFQLWRHGSIRLAYNNTKATMHPQLWRHGSIRLAYNNTKATMPPLLWRHGSLIFAHENANNWHAFR